MGTPDRKFCMIAPSSRLIGGQATAAHGLLRELTSDGGVRITFVPIDPELRGFLHWVRRIRFLRTIVHFYFYWLSLVSAARAADVFPVFSASDWSFVVTTMPAIVVSKAFGKPILLQDHGGEAEDHLRNWPTARWVCGRVDAIVVPSGYLVDVFRTFGLEAKDIPNFVELESLPYRCRDPLQPKFLSNRMHEELYDVRCIVRAFALIQRQRPASSLQIVGGGSLTEAFRRQVKALELKNVEFAGFLDHRAMLDVYDECDVCLNTPTIDNMPSTLFEASACGLAIVSSNVGGIPYIVEHDVTALLMEPEDPEAVAAAAPSLLDDPVFARSLTRAARGEYERLYAWKVLGSQWREVYDSLLKHHDASGVR